MYYYTLFYFKNQVIYFTFFKNLNFLKIVLINFVYYNYTLFFYNNQVIYFTFFKKLYTNQLGYTPIP